VKDMKTASGVPVPGLPILVEVCSIACLIWISLFSVCTVHSVGVTILCTSKLNLCNLNIILHLTSGLVDQQHWRYCNLQPQFLGCVVLLQKIAHCHANLVSCFLALN
jgi:hypothetical protein